MEIFSNTTNNTLYKNITMYWTSIVSLLLSFVVASVHSEVKSYSDCLYPGTDP